MKYVKPDFDVTIYELDDVITADGPSKVEFTTEEEEDWWG